MSVWLLLIVRGSQASIACRLYYRRIDRGALLSLAYAGAMPCWAVADQPTVVLSLLEPTLFTVGRRPARNRYTRH